MVYLGTGYMKSGKWGSHAETGTPAWGYSGAIIKSSAPKFKILNRL
jgi:hypothetical protein